MKRELGIAILACIIFAGCSKDENPVSTTEAAGAIAGNVTTASGQLPVAGATITTEPASASVTTDANGAYTIANLEHGVYIVTASKSSFHNSSVSIRVSSGATTTANIVLADTSVPNRAPYKPALPTGPSIGYRNNYYQISTLATDPDSDYVCYRFAFSNGDTLGWSTYYPSGMVNYCTYTFVSMGTITVRAQARDEHGVCSPWSDSLLITIVNRPPSVPSSPYPTNGSVLPYYYYNYTLYWSCYDPDWDQVYFDIYYGTTNPPPLLADSLTSSNWYVTFAASTTYYWKIVAYDSCGATATGPVWSFSTSSPKGK
jgi:hypothetical protein